MRPLSPDDLLHRDPLSQAVELPDGRLLIRHAGGLTVLHGVAAAPLRAALGEGRSLRAAEVLTALEASYGKDAALRLLSSLVGEMVHVATPQEEQRSRAEPPRPPIAGRTVAVLGNGAAARRFVARRERAASPPLRLVDIESVAGEALHDSGGMHIPPPPRAPIKGPAKGPALPREAEQLFRTTRRELADRLRGAALAVCMPEALPYRDLFAIQEACLDAGVPSLMLTADPDGVRLGPLTVPGVSPCLACAQIAAFRVLRLETGALLGSIQSFRTGDLLSSPSGQDALAALEDEIERVLGGAEPALAAEVLWFAPGGETRRLPVERVPGCPVCSATKEPARQGAPLAARASLAIAESQDRGVPRAFPADPEGLVGSVGILGGGTAGYLAALALRRKVPHVKVTLIESSEVPVIGVGEATTPLMPQFLHVDLDLDVHQLFREVRPTFKLGIRFLWGEPGTGDFNYPFGPVHLLEPVVYGGDVRDCSLQSLLMAAGALPIYEEGAAWSSRLGTGVAYHLDNERFVAYLQRRAAERGVERIDASIEQVERADNGDEVRALVARDGRRFSFDLYIDCSGFRSLLLEQALGSPWIGFESSLPTDRAVVAPVPHGGRFRPYTTAETMSSGWCWSTPQSDADHRGYVFASSFQTPEGAEAEMRSVNPGMGPARLVRFRAGRHAHFWTGNVVALGNSYGFVEPLESTALHMLIREIGLLVRSFPLRRGERGFQALLNRKVEAWWDYLRWFLAIHYRFNRRLDSAFWRACREEVDVSSHAELLEVFHERGPLSYESAARAAFDYPDPLWGPEGIDTLLLGQGVRGRLPRPVLGPDAWAERLRLARSIVARAAPHERALEILARHPELLDRMVAQFRAAGPAFPAG
ncbi:MAG TPA: TOMM precursor leader peptide-binding protein [Thermoanaerobaculia bacterium]|nr:TOMM precursor leader peptide-binding protein [Thermoanaerobaculia bacterium]